MIMKSLNTAKELYTGIKTLVDQGELIANRKEALYLLDLALQASAEAMELQHSNALLKQEATELNAKFEKLAAWFQSEQPKYQLLALADNALVYTLKPDQQTAQPIHYLCANCFTNQQKSILQADGYVSVERKLSCHICNAYVLYRDKRDDFSPQVFSTKRRDFW